MKDELLEGVARALGYIGDPGYVSADAFSRQPNHRHALRLAHQRMGVHAAFGLWTTGAGALRAPKRDRFTPLVFLAAASDESGVREVHKRVWSQGLVPYLLVSTGQRLWLCQGFGYSSRRWDSYAIELSVPDLVMWRLESEPGELVRGGSLAPLASLSARALRTSVAWRDFAKTEEDYVDGRLLRALAELTVAFGHSAPNRNGLKPAATNALIARLLYLYFLVDRGFVTQELLESWGLGEIRVLEPVDWPIEATRRLFRRLEDVFNGSIFPMRAEHEEAIGPSHVNDLRRVLRHGGELGIDEQLQYGFLDYDFASIRTETLSAIYEMFLRSEEADAGRRFGAYYTPPFLADYLLDRLEDEVPLRDGMRVLDPAAGSGVFLVGAYRRIVEAELPSGQDRLPLDQLHRLMTHNVFGVELNETACGVAAFSLYLTMLDYLEPARTELDPAGAASGWRLFPPMLSRDDGMPPNIRNADFFTVEPDVDRVQVVVGNPPWVQLKKLGSVAARTYARDHAREMPIGDEQGAELFAWKALWDHLAPDGVLGLLLPMKSLVNTFSDRFTAAIRERTEVIGVADLSHLRYVLFRKPVARSTKGSEKASSDRSRQPAAALLVRCRAPRHGHHFWVYRPLRPTQPIGKRGRLWTLLQDWTQVHWHMQTELDGRGWLQTLNCSPVDRRILNYLNRAVDGERFLTLGDLEQHFGLAFKIEVNQNIDPQYVLSTDERSANFWLRQIRQEERASLLPAPAPLAVPLPAEQLAKAAPTSRPFLQGNIVLMPRSCERAEFVEPPVAFSFSMVGACFPALAGQALPQEHYTFLRALAAYMGTAPFRYLAFVSGRRMAIDRAQIELQTIRSLPWPFGGPGDKQLSDFIKRGSPDRQELVYEAFGISRLFRDAIEEFLDFRIAFRDGATAPSATRSLDVETEFEAYADMLTAQINGGKDKYRATWCPVAESNSGSVVIQFQGYGVEPGCPADALALAIADYRAHSASELAQSRYIWHSPKRMESVLIKPLERLHWTRERAYADGDAVAAAVMSGFDSEAAA